MQFCHIVTWVICEVLFNSVGSFFFPFYFVIFWLRMSVYVTTMRKTCLGPMQSYNAPDKAQHLCFLLYKHLLKFNFSLWCSFCNYPFLFYGCCRHAFLQISETWNLHVSHAEFDCFSNGFLPLTWLVLAHVLHLSSGRGVERWTAWRDSCQAACRNPVPLCLWRVF